MWFQFENGENFADRSFTCKVTFHKKYESDHSKDLGTTHSVHIYTRALKDFESGKHLLELEVNGGLI